MSSRSDKEPISPHSLALPCPCGSKMAHQWCCFPELAAQAAGQAYDVRQRFESAIMTLVVNDSLEHTPLEQCEAAWQDFTFGSGRKLEHKDLTVDSHFREFLAWFLFRRLSSGTIPALNAVARAQGDMPVYEMIINAVIEQPYSFWLAGEFEPGRCMSVKDLLLDREFVLNEPLISALSEPGDVFYGRVVKINNIDGFFVQELKSLPLTVVPTIVAFKRVHQPKSLEDLHQLDDLTRGLWERLWDEYDDEEDMANEANPVRH